MKTNFIKIKEFHDKFSRTKDPETPTLRDEPNRRLRAELIFEETKELLHELGYRIVYNSFGEVAIQLNPHKTELSLENIAKESADLKYVTYGTDSALGIPADKVYAEVHDSNMSKIGPDGEVLRRPDGKVLKGPHYKPVNLSWLVEE